MGFTGNTYHHRAKDMESLRDSLEIMRHRLSTDMEPLTRFGGESRCAQGELGLARAKDEKD